MLNQNSSPSVLDLDSWVDSSKSDPVRYRQRQVTHILLHAVAMTPVLRDNLCLKGGTLMSAAYHSIRVTGDVDFSAVAAPEPFTEELRATLDKALTAAAADLAYLDLKMRVQRFTRRPREGNFKTANGPALEMSIGIAARMPKPASTSAKHPKFWAWISRSKSRLSTCRSSASAMARSLFSPTAQRS